MIFGKDNRQGCLSATIGTIRKQLKSTAAARELGSWISECEQL
jgi:hypothetical protein